MRVVFMGTPELAAHVFSTLIDHQYTVVGVVTQQDKAQGRHAKLQASPVKQLAHLRIPDVPILQPARAKDLEFIEKIRALNPDLAIVAAYGQILPQTLLDIPKLGCINVHYSLLPKLRGAAPIQRAILEGYTSTGVTIMRMVQKMDAGAILAQEEVSIDPTTTAGQLRDMLTKISGPLLISVLEDLQRGQVQEVEQDEHFVTMAPKIETQDAQINWQQSAVYLHRLIRAMDPEPGAWCCMYLKGQLKRVKFFEPNIVEVSQPIYPGQILALGKQLVIGTGEGAIGINCIQPEGRPIMTVAAFSAGYKLQDLSMG